jgi:hypothetical protein
MTDHKHPKFSARSSLTLVLVLALVATWLFAPAPATTVAYASPVPEEAAPGDPLLASAYVEGSINLVLAPGYDTAGKTPAFVHAIAALEGCQGDASLVTFYELSYSADQPKYAFVHFPREVSVPAAIAAALTDPLVISAGIDGTYHIPENPPPVVSAYGSVTSAIDDGLVMDVEGASTNNGAKAQTYSRNWTVAQMFCFGYDFTDDTYSLMNTRSGKVLDVPGNIAVEG